MGAWLGSFSIRQPGEVFLLIFCCPSPNSMNILAREMICGENPHCAHWWHEPRVPPSPS